MRIVATESAEYVVVSGCTVQMVATESVEYVVVPGCTVWLSV